MRNNYLDNAKVMLIFLVVFGHAIYTTNESLSDLKWLIYTFHMPAFIFIAGFFEKKKEWKRVGKEIFWSCVIPYIVFQTIHNLVRVIFLDTQMREIILPNYTLWFLMALIVFKVLIQLVIRMPLLFITIYIIHFLIFDIYIVENYYYYAQGRIAIFFIFYMVGYYAKQYYKKNEEKIKRIFDKKWRYLIGTIFLISLGILKTKDIEILSQPWVQGILSNLKNYEDMGQKEIIIGRIETLLIQIIGLIGFLLIVPKKGYKWTEIGSLTLSIYLFHAVLIRILGSFGVFKGIDRIETIFTTLGITIILMYINLKVLNIKKFIYLFPQIKDILSIKEFSIQQYLELNKNYILFQLLIF